MRTATDRPAAARDRRRARRGLRSTALALAAATALSACASLDIPQMPGPAVTDFVPTQVPQATPTSSGNLSPDGFQQAQRMAVRIRNVGCDSLSPGSGVAIYTGSGFAIGPTTLITNRHVVANSASLQVATYDGRDVAVTATSTAALADLALVRTAQELPSYPFLAGSDPEIGAEVTVVGYPEGGQLTLTRGRVIGSTTDPLNENFGQVLVTDAQVEPGSSGSAVLDAEGRVVGVVYAKNASDQSFFVPVSTLGSLLADDGSFTAAPACVR